MKKFTYYFTALLLTLTTFNANAVEPLPPKPGWSGLFSLGAGYASTKTNMLAGIKLFSFEPSDPIISSLNEEPNRNSQFIPQVNLNIKYTFPTQSQIFFGNSVEDILTFDTAAILGFRQQFKDKSRLEVSIVSTPILIPIQTWADPYVVNEHRKRVDQISRGLRLEYFNLLNSGFGIQLTARRREIDEELSGQTQLTLTPAQEQLLDREGDVLNLALYYRSKPIKKKYLFEIKLNGRNDDYDGKAMAGDVYGLQFTYGYIGTRFTTALNLFARTKDFDEINPIYNVTREDDLYGIGLALIDKKLIRHKNWFTQIIIAWFDLDSNIDFYKTETTLISLSAQFRF